MQRTVLMALLLGLLTATPAVAADLFKTDPTPAVEEKTAAAQGLGVLAPLGCSLGSGQTVLVDGVSVTGTLDATTGANCEFVYNPPLTHNGAKFTMAPATSDFDLYIKKGAVPTTSVYDCRPFSGGTTVETCLAAVADGTPIYVMVRRFSGSGDFTITGSATTIHPQCDAGNLPLATGESVAYSTPVALGAACYFQLTPGANDDIVRFVATPEGAAYGLYVKRGSVPTTSSYDCIASSSFLVRTCEVVADGRDMFVMVRRSSSTGLGQFSLDAIAITLPQLALGQPVQAQVAQGQYQYYKVVVPAGSKLLAVAIAGPSPAYACNALEFAAAEQVCGAEVGTQADADLYVAHQSKGKLPTTLSSTHDCRSIAIGTQDACLFSSDLSGAMAAGSVPSDPLAVQGLGAGPMNVKGYIGDGKYFVGVRGFTGPADYVITAVYA